MKKKLKQQEKDTSNLDNLNIEDNYANSKKWYEEIVEDVQNCTPVTEQILIELKDEAKKCHDSEVAHYNIKNSKTNSNYQWMKTIMSKGTLSDKIAAHTVAIQDGPISNLETIRNLVNMVKVGKKKECTMLMDTLTELFLTDLLKPDQKLKSFHQRPLSALNEMSSGNAITRRRLLSAWYFEDQLKEIYASFVLALNKATHDTVESNKEKAIAAMYKLLCGNPEQEKNLLVYIVNKLGDPSQKVASKAIYSLGQLLFKHPNMQTVVLNEVEKLLFRQNVSTKAQYYGLCFLSQFYLSHETSDVARRLIEVYFSFFKACLKKGEVDSRMMSALLMGVNRAYPYAKLELEKISEHIDTMYRIVHVANFNISLHALTLLYQVSDYANNINDRFYCALYKKLVDSKLFTTTHQAMLLSLVYKALLKDKETSRIKVFVKRLLQLSLFSQPSFSCGILYLISQLMGKRENLQALILKQSIPSNTEDDDDDGEEKYHDVKDENEIKPERNDNEQDRDDVNADLNVLNNHASSWHHSKGTTKKDYNQSVFCPINRNPLYAGGEFCAYTELINLKNHFHPTVALYAANLLNGELIKYSGDPLKDFTLIRFLDRFVFKNPKKIDDTKGAHPTFGKRKTYKPKGLKSIPINSANYLNEHQNKIPVDELFLYTYLQSKQQCRNIDDDSDSDLDSVQSDEFIDMLDKMHGKTPEIDDDLDFMNDVKEGIKSTSKTKSKRDVDDDDDDDDDDDEDNQKEIDNDDDDDEDDMELDDDDDDEDMKLDEDDEDIGMDDDDKYLLDDINDDDDDEDIVFNESENGEQKNHKNRFTKTGGDDLNSLFASAEEFASILDDEGASTLAPGGGNTFANNDNASNKQIAWEDKRNRWLTGFNKAIGKRNSRTKKSTTKRPKRDSSKRKNKKLKK